MLLERLEVYRNSILLLFPCSDSQFPIPVLELHHVISHSHGISMENGRNPESPLPMQSAITDAAGAERMSTAHASTRDHIRFVCPFGAVALTFATHHC